MVFRKMSILGEVYGKDNEECEDALLKGCTNFSMSDESFKKILAEKINNNRQYENAQTYLHHLALCHTIVTSKDPRDETKIILNSSSPDELSLLNAAKYFGVRFVERNEFNELVIQEEADGARQRGGCWSQELRRRRPWPRTPRLFEEASSRQERSRQKIPALERD